MAESTGKIKAILFDFGETLLNFGEVKSSDLFKKSAKLSYDFLNELAQPVGNFKYYCFKNLITLRIRFWVSNRTGNDFNALTVLKNMGTRAGYNLSDKQWEHLAWLWYEPLGEIGKSEPDIVDTLSKLTESGLKLGIISNTSVHRTSLEKHLQDEGMLVFFTERMFSYEFDFRKPDPRIFKIGAERLGEAPGNIMFIGDRLDKDVEPALKIGMTAVLKTAYTNAGKKVPAGAYTIDDLAELPKLIEQINSTKS